MKWILPPCLHFQRPALPPPFQSPLLWSDPGLGQHQELFHVWHPESQFPTAWAKIFCLSGLYSPVHACWPWFRLKSTKMSSQPFISFHRKSSYLSMSSHLRSWLKTLCCCVAQPRPALCSPRDCSLPGSCPCESLTDPPLLLKTTLKFSQLLRKETPFFSQLLLPQSQSIHWNQSRVCCRITRIKTGKHIGKGWDQDYETTKAFWGKGFEKEATRNQGVEKKWKKSRCVCTVCTNCWLKFLHCWSSVYKNCMNLLQLKRAVVHPVGLNSREVRCESSGIPLLPD